MKRQIKRLQKRRRYSEDFKRRIVTEFETGQLSVLQLSKLYGISDQSIYEWIYKYSTFNEKGVRIVEDNQSSTEKVKQLEKQLRELEAMLGRKQIQLDFLDKMIELASEELGVDIKKNYSSRPSDGSDKTDKQ